jgi:hypothetical protein
LATVFLEAPELCSGLHLALLGQCITPSKSAAGSYTITCNSLD